MFENNNNYANLAFHKYDELLKRILKLEGKEKILQNNSLSYSDIVPISAINNTINLKTISFDSNSGSFNISLFLNCETVGNGEASITLFLENKEFKTIPLKNVPSTISLNFCVRNATAGVCNVKFVVISSVISKLHYSSITITGEKLKDNIVKRKMHYNIDTLFINNKNKVSMIKNEVQQADLVGYSYLNYLTNNYTSTNYIGITEGGNIIVDDSIALLGRKQPVVLNATMCCTAYLNNTMYLVFVKNNKLYVKLSEINSIDKRLFFYIDSTEYLLNINVGRIKEISFTKGAKPCMILVTDTNKAYLYQMLSSPFEESSTVYSLFSKDYIRLKDGENYTSFTDYSGQICLHYSSDRVYRTKLSYVGNKYVVSDTKLVCYDRQAVLANINGMYYVETESGLEFKKIIV